MKNLAIPQIAKWAKLLSIAFLAGTALTAFFIIYHSINMSGHIDYETIITTALISVWFWAPALLLFNAAQKLIAWDKTGNEVLLQRGMHQMRLAMQWAASLTIIFFVLIFLFFYIASNSHWD